MRVVTSIDQTEVRGGEGGRGREGGREGQEGEERRGERKVSSSAGPQRRDLGDGAHGPWLGAPLPALLRAGHREGEVRGGQPVGASLSWGGGRAWAAGGRAWATGVEPGPQGTVTAM